MASNTGCMSAGAGNWSGRSNSAPVDWMRPNPQIGGESRHRASRLRTRPASALRLSSKVNSHLLLAISGARVRSVSHDGAARQRRFPKHQKPLICELAVAAARHARRYVADGCVHPQGSRDRRPHPLAQAFECLARNIKCDALGKTGRRRRGINAENELIDAQ
jgi:hypothetical protein